jgi:hypothetical protein
MAYPVVLCRSFLRGSATPIDDEWKFTIARRNKHTKSDGQIIKDFHVAYFQGKKKRMGRTIHESCIYIPMAMTLEEAERELEIRGYVKP